MSNNESTFLTVRAAAQMLGLSEGAVRVRIKRGQLPRVKLGKSVLIPRAELNAALLVGSTQSGRAT